MPNAALDLLAVAALVMMLVTAFVHPPWWAEVLVGAVAAGGLLLATAVTVPAALEEGRLLLPVVAFLAGILVVAELCSVAGVFAAVGALVARTGRGSPRRMLGLTFLAAALITAALSLDATVVLFTPVVAAAAASTRTSPRPLVLACVRLANSASLLLPVSNLTNLLALPALPGLSFLGFAGLMEPVSLAVVGVEYVGHRIWFRADLVGPTASTPRSAPASDPPHLPVLPVTVVALMLAGFALLSPLGVEPAWVAGAAALALAASALLRRRVTVGHVVGAAHLSFGFFVLCLGVVVAALSATFLGDLVRSVVPSGDGLASLLLVAVIATVLANLVNNLPATLLLVPLVAPAGPVVVLAALVGLGAGSNLTYTGSLANLLWRRTLARAGTPASTREFHLLSAALTLPTVMVGTVVLWAWSGLVS